MKQRNLLPWVVIALAVIALYGRTITFEFVDIDDDVLITNNPVVQEISLQSITQAFTSYDPELYIPFTLMSWQGDWLLGKGSPLPFHLSNILLHLVNALLVFWVGTLLTKHTWAAFFMGFLFAIHPLHTETVVWPSMRKELLFTTFFLLSFGLYLRFLETKNREYYLGSIATFFLGLLAKVSILVLPVILICTYIQRNERNWKDIGAKMTPYIVLSVIFGLVALGGKSSQLSQVSTLDLLLMAPRTIGHYIYRLIIPTDLSIVYPFIGQLKLSNPEVALPIFLGSIIVLIVYYLHQMHRWILFGSAFFLVTVAPSLMNIRRWESIQYAADHYAYLPSVGFLIILAVAITQSIPKLKPKEHTTMLTTIAIILAVPLSYLTWQNTNNWQTNEKLFQHALALHPHSYVALNSLGNVAWKEGNFDRALERYNDALGLKPRNTHVLRNIASTYEQKGEINSAIFVAQEAVFLEPKNAQNYMTLGEILARAGRKNEAMKNFEKALELTGQL